MEMLHLCSKRRPHFSLFQSLKGPLRVQAPSPSPWMQKGRVFKVGSP